MDQRQSSSPTESQTRSRPPRSRPPPSRLAHSHLAALPNELLGQIFSHLRPDSEPCQLGPNPNGYTDLLALCVTRRDMGAIALCALYDTVVVRSERDMAQLLDLLIQYPERQSWIRTFCCLASLSRRMGEVPCVPRHVEPLSPAAHLYLTAGPEEHSNSKLAAMFDVLKTRDLDPRATPEFRQRLYYALLCLMPALHTLEFPADITGRTWDEFDEFDRRCWVPHLSSMAKKQLAVHPILADLLHLGFQGSAAQSESPTKDVPCPNVRSLKFSSVEGFWSAYQAIPFFHFPKLKTITLEFRGDFWSPALLWRPCKPGIWPTPVDAAKVFAAVKHLSVFPSSISSQVISSLAEVAAITSQLETLEIGGERPGRSLFSTYDCRRSPSLNHGILHNLSNTLRRLAVYGKWASLWDCRQLFGYRQKLVNLDRLVRLEELVVPSFAIFGALFMERREASSWVEMRRSEPFLPMPASFNPDDLGAPDNAPEYADPTNSGDPKNPDKLVQVARTTKLPPALKVLEIYEDAYSDYRWTTMPYVQWYPRLPRSSGKLFRFMKEFAFDSRNRFPRMERVVFWAQDWRGCTPQWTDEEVQEAKEVFSAQGVEFMYRECPEPSFGAPVFRLPPR